MKLYSFCVIFIIKLSACYVMMKLYSFYVIFIIILSLCYIGCDPEFCPGRVSVFFVFVFLFFLVAVISQNESLAVKVLH